MHFRLEVQSNSSTLYQGRRPRNESKPRGCPHFFLNLKSNSLGAIVCLQHIMETETHSTKWVSVKGISRNLQDQSFRLDFLFLFPIGFAQVKTQGWF